MPNAEPTNLEFVTLAFPAAIDPLRVWAAGFSNGGMMSNRLACEAPETFRAVATAAGTIAINGDEQTTGIRTCTKSHNKAIKAAGGSGAVAPVSVLDIHGGKDAYVPPAGNPFLGFPSTKDTMASWAKRANCIKTPVDVKDFKKSGAFTTSTWQNCSEDAVIELVMSEEGDHAWYQGSDFDATTYALDFFERAAESVYDIKPTRPLAASPSTASAPAEAVDEDETDEPAAAAPTTAPTAAPTPIAITIQDGQASQVSSSFSSSSGSKASSSSSSVSAAGDAADDDAPVSPEELKTLQTMAAAMGMDPTLAEKALPQVRVLLLLLLLFVMRSQFRLCVLRHSSISVCIHQ